MNVVDRLAASGISPFRAWQHVIAGRLLVDGHPVLDPRTVPEPAAVLTLVAGGGHVRPVLDDAWPPPWTGPRGPQRVTEGTPAVALRIG